MVRGGKHIARGPGAVLAAGLLLTCPVACTSDDEPSGEPSGWTFLGDEVVDVDESLAAADRMWQQAWSSWDQVVAVPDDSRCWFIADDAGALEQQGVCGPFRGLGTPAAEWVQVQFTPEAPETGTVRMVPTALSPVQPGVVRRSLTLVRPAGGEPGKDGKVEEGEWDPRVAPPTGWPRTLPVGRVRSGTVQRFGAEVVARGRVRVDGFVQTVRVVRPRKVQLADRGTYVPRKGQAFAEFRFAPFDSHRAVEAGLALDQSIEAGEIRLRVESGGRSWSGVHTTPVAGPVGQGQAAVVEPPSGLFVLPQWPPWDEPTFTVVVGRKTYDLRPVP